MRERIWLARPKLSEDEIKSLTSSIETNWISTSGGQKEGFKDELKEYLSYSGGLCLLNSATSALHLALILAGVSSKDHVLCSSFTFVASANPIQYVGATPVFIDSELETWNMCPVLLEEAIVDLEKKSIKPKVLVLVHLYGVPAKIDLIKAITDRYGIILIEDAAGAFGTDYKGQKVGTFGEYGVFSFNGNKIITSGTGGLLLTKNINKQKEAEFLSTQAKEAKEHYEHKVLGFNYAMNNLSAAVGRPQLVSINTFLERKRKVFDQYYDQLSSFGIMFLIEKQGQFINRWLTCVIFKTSEQKECVRLHLEKLNVESRNIWKPMHLQPLYEKEDSYLNGNSEAVFNKGLCLPSDINMTEEDQAFVIKEILNCLRK